ncbi:DNA-binding response regulator [Bifidobacterium pseudolongum subsp. globosum]|uniref:DNA-binding response regulator n=1 Tax=Bifidobacterium pseudolongum subsp. globosum TaxID=1690 RepID=A0A4Q5A4L6_9BIFI|nr:response regulator transcription factor [Bifidobacterium pseudolongum]RYQ12502.1 DNA-binding response regulator [Bifidobacterium pseudolongum subsp. globosum]
MAHNTMDENGAAQTPITVIVVDDDPMIGQTMRIILNDYSNHHVSVCAIATSGRECLEQIAQHNPNVVLVDIAMPGMDGIELTRAIRANTHAPHVLILTSLGPTDTVQRAVEAGAEGFISKTDAPEDIIRRIIGVCDGTPQFNPASERQLINDLHAQQPNARRQQARAMLDALPEREREAVILAAEGLTNQQIAQRMFISERTAKAHLSAASNRLCMGRTQMARLVERADLP